MYSRHSAEQHSRCSNVEHRHRWHETLSRESPMSTSALSHQPADAQYSYKSYCLQSPTPISVDEQHEASTADDDHWDNDLDVDDKESEWKQLSLERHTDAYETNLLFTAHRSQWTKHADSVAFTDFMHMKFGRRRQLSSTMITRSRRMNTMEMLLKGRSNEECWNGGRANTRLLDSCSECPSIGTVDRQWREHPVSSEGLDRVSSERKARMIIGHPRSSRSLSLDLMFAGRQNKWSVPFEENDQIRQSIVPQSPTVSVRSRMIDTGDDHNREIERDLATTASTGHRCIQNPRCPDCPN